MKCKTRTRWRLLAALGCMAGTLALCAGQDTHHPANVLIVAADGSEQFKTVQEAINAAPVGSRTNPAVIRIKPGVYKELIYIQREKRFLQLVGENAEKTVLSYDLYASLPGPDGKPIGTFRTASTYVDADDFTAEKLTFENAAGPKGQALAIRVEGDRVAFRHCRFLGWQDTILDNRGRHYYQDCYIAGHVDFIFGGATSFFEGCHIHCLKDGYITAASTPEDQAIGFVFSKCVLTGETPQVRTYLGRPWRGYAGVAFLNTQMSEVVRTAGWDNWKDPAREKTARFAEYQSTGPGGGAEGRVKWARQLTDQDLKTYSLESVLGGTDHWDPRELRVSGKDSSAPEWSQVSALLAQIKEPTFPSRDFPVTRFGAATDGKSDCTEAIRLAVAACAEAGGGRVVVPAGEFLTGPIHLKSNVELHLDSGATLRFTTNPAAYLPAVLTRFEGMECYNYSPLIYAFGQENVAVTGEGLLDGQAGEQNWWAWKGGRQVQPGAPNQNAARQRLVKMVEENVPVEQRRFGTGDCLRPSFIEMYRCRNVLIQGVHLRRSPMWELHPALSTNVMVRGVDISSHGPNNDGCDPESCRDVLIENCTFDTGDDCIAIKSGRNNDGRRLGVASENVLIRHCTMKEGHGGVVIGSEISGGCRNVFAEDCRMDSPNLERVLRLKSNAVRGGVIENIFMRNITVGRVADAVLQIDFVYEEGANGPYKPAARNIVMENVTVSHTPRVLNIVGFPGAEISGVRLYNSTFKELQKPDVVRDAGDVKLVGCVTERN